MPLTKIDDRGLNTPIDLLDNEKIRLGTGNDLEIYHTGGGHNFVEATGQLRLCGTTNVVTRASAFGDVMINAIVDGAVELYYDNSKKFETTSTGAGVTGDLALSGELNMTTGGNYNRFIDCSLDDGEGLYIRSTNGGDANHQYMAIFQRQGAVELYHAAAKKFETTSSGIQVTGQVYTDTAHVNGELDLVGHLDLNSDNHRIKLGAGDDFQLYHDGSNNYITTNNGDIIMQTTGDDIQLLAQDDITLKTFGGVETAINCVGNGAVELYHDNGLKFFTGANGIYFPNHGTLHEKAIHFEVGQNTGEYGTLFGVTNYPDHGGYNNQSAGHWARIQSKGGCVVIINSDASNRNDGRNGFDHFSVYQRAGESTNGKRLFSVDGEGAAQFGRAGIRIDNAWGAQPSITVQRNNNDNTDNTNDGAYMRVHGIGQTHESWTGASPGADFSVNFIIDGSTYATSDRRAKTDIVDCPYGLDVVNKLQPRKFQLVNSALTPQGDDNINLGFIAQEIKEHIPECVNYLGDEANTPNEKGWARAYALDIGEVIPVLTKAIQELSDKVKTLETKVAALEAK